jgi:hypothetical protein
MWTGYDSKTGSEFLHLRPVLTGNSEVEGSFHEEGDGRFLLQMDTGMTARADRQTPGE